VDQLVGASTSIRACGAAGELQDDIAINSDVPAGAPNAVHTHQCIPDEVILVRFFAGALRSYN
jgi:hypothetical protein